MAKKKGNLEEFLGAPFVPDPDIANNPAYVLQELVEAQGHDVVDEDFAAMAQYLSQQSWETLNPADSEWHTAAPVESLHELAPAETESVSPLWDGPLKETPLTIFDKTFDAEALESAVSRAPVFHKLTGRFDPFEVDRMRVMLEGAHYSTFLHRPILAFRDCLDHSIQLCRFWAEEDAATEAAKQKENPEWVAPPPTSNDKDERIEAARVAWKDAVAKRKEAVAQWDAYVAEMRLRYNYEKRGR